MTRYQILERLAELTQASIALRGEAYVQAYTQCQALGRRLYELDHASPEKDC